MFHYLFSQGDSNFCMSTSHLFLAGFKQVKAACVWHWYLLVRHSLVSLVRYSSPMTILAPWLMLVGSSCYQKQIIWGRGAGDDYLLDYLMICYFSTRLHAMCADRHFASKTFCHVQLFPRWHRTSLWWDPSISFWGVLCFFLHPWGTRSYELTTTINKNLISFLFSFTSTYNYWIIRLGVSVAPN